MRMKLSFSLYMCAALIGTALSGLPIAAKAQGFLSAAGDIPLADGLVELPDGVMVFDKPQGRIVQLTAARETANAQSVADFYRAALPNLGWVLADDSESVLTFTGQAEILRLTFTADLVIFDVKPEAR